MSAKLLSVSAVTKPGTEIPPSLISNHHSVKVRVS